jgi:hypothetical protein
VEAKVLYWLESGITLVLVVDCARSATTYRGRGEAQVHREHDTLDLGDGVPGWRETVAELFD